MLAKLKSLSYSLALLTSGESFAQTIAANASAAVASMVWDFIDTVSAVFDIAKTARLKAADMEAQALALDVADHELLQDTLNRIPEKYIDGFFKRMKTAISSRVGKDFDPAVIEELYHSVSETGITQGAQFTYSALNVFGWIETSFLNRHRAFSKRMLADVANGLSTREIDSNKIDALGKAALVSYTDFTALHQERLEFTYMQSEIKRWGDLFRGTVIQGFNLAYPQAMKVFVTTVDGVWGASKTLISTDQAITWFKAYADNQRMVLDGLEAVTHVAYAPTDVYEMYLGAHVAYAADSFIPDPTDPLQAMYDNEIASEHPDRAIVVENYEADADLALYEDLAILMDLVVKMDPQDEEATAFKAELEALVGELEHVVEDTESQMKEMESIEPQVKVGGLWWQVVIFWVLVIIFIPGIVLMSKWRKKSVKKQKKKKAHRFVFISLYVFVWSVLFFTNAVYMGFAMEEQISLGISEEAPEELIISE